MTDLASKTMLELQGLLCAAKQSIEQARNCDSYGAAQWEIDAYAYYNEVNFEIRKRMVG